MRNRIKIARLISHTTPNGKSEQSSLSKCLAGISKIERGINRAYKALGENKRVTEEKYKVIMIWGKPLKLTIEEYNKYCI